MHAWPDVVLQRRTDERMCAMLARTAAVASVLWTRSMMRQCWQSRRGRTGQARASHSSSGATWALFPCSEC
eukprot:12882171-Prorocentrum_lima.AAC.1